MTLPGTLLSLTFGTDFNQPLERVTWPRRLLGCSKAFDVVFNFCGLVVKKLYQREGVVEL